jgi:cytochrome c oxidase subunit 2
MTAAPQSVLHPAGAQAVLVGDLYTVITVVCSVVWLLVAVAAWLAIRRGRRGMSTATEPQLARRVGAATGATGVILIGILLATVLTTRAMDRLRVDDPLRVRVTGNQWWWDVQYPNPTPSLSVTTANEIHIPVGRQVEIDLLSTDVIHSLWIPELQGKIDLVPGRLNTLWLEADHPGVFRGQCAEYCGAQHANMALTVVAHPPGEFEHWLAANRAPAAAPTTAQQTRGQSIVVHGPCSMCHAVTGTSAGGRTAPDLTHLASRQTIAAGTLPNTRGYLAGWIADPQHAKPGSRMPPMSLTGADLQDVLAYLETLK